MTLEVRALNKLFATGADKSVGIKDVAFTLAPGKFFTLLGPSGCGKTTTLRSIAGLQEPDSGYIGVGGRPFYDSSRNISVPLNERGIGMVFQSYAIWPHMSVAQNVSFPLRVRPDIKLSGAEIESKTRKALAAVALEEVYDRPATRLSGGQQQRVALARAIVAEPQLLLLDEPLSNLDAALRETTRAELKRLQRQLGVTTVYVTHDQVEALEMSDEIAVMNRGEIVQLGTPKDIYLRPVNRFVATFIGTTNLLAGSVLDAVAANGIGTVRLANGTLIQSVFPAKQQAGAKVEVSIRPENIRISAKRAAAQDGENLLHGTVALASFLGSMNRYEIRCGDLLVQTSALADAEFPVGTEVSLCFAPRHTAVVAD
ncbi:ABC transporter ATP-binding protein [Candidimonas nitroreducens]|uniref:Fe3+/spermidine/putrescine ABC transporter ATP-binding protein n=1 Tax=Candidimonas nitroreducens TaxID=683354 RepID=A0A225LY37_9BURK|nr:ABC transporter ATP-binding protein [Candidimonas nitroreducens]OWT53936.1 Fe3+/spermidine/putrescine ABC transporter ATP-binding protein [Candidimonas nitroreducens]